MKFLKRHRLQLMKVYLTDEDVRKLAELCGYFGGDESSYLRRLINEKHFDEFGSEELEAALAEMSSDRSS